MDHKLISGRTITELYRYLQGNGGSYNELRNCFRNSGMAPNQDVQYSSTRNRDRFLDEYIQPLQLDEEREVEKLIKFLEQVIDFSNPPQYLLESLQRDGWQIVGNVIARVGHTVEELVRTMLQGLPIETIQREWDRAKLSVANDPADAITAASSMIEATYKFILHDANQPYPQNQDIRSLSRAVHQLLGVSPEQEADQDFRSIFQGVLSIIQGLGSIRTKIGDAHGASPTRGNPLERHARLAINQAGSICLFLLETYGAQKSAITR